MEAKDLVAALVKSGLTQAQIAERTGIPQPTLSKVLRGNVDDVLSRKYRKLEALHNEVLGQPAPEPSPPTEHAAACEPRATKRDIDPIFYGPTAPPAIARVSDKPNCSGAGER